MTRLVSAFPLLFAACCAFAQSAPAEPAEHASTATVVVFLVLFVGSCVGYIGYVLWDARKNKHTEDK
jgi:hypothetical protein